jgi:diaminopimelate decarboxylase
MGIEPVAAPRKGAKRPYDVVGPVCESGDFFAHDRDLPPLEAGDLVVLRQAGAYGAVMSSTYNARPLAPELLVRAGKTAIVRPRQTLDDLIGADRLAPWQRRRKL